LAPLQPMPIPKARPKPSITPKPKSKSKRPILIVVVIVIVVVFTCLGYLYHPYSSKPNEPPTARITTSTIDTYQRVAVNFNGLTSTDPEKKSLTYAWDFGDGEQSIQPAPQRKFSNIGTFHVKLTVTDDKGEIGIATTDVKVKNALEMKANLISSDSQSIRVDVQVTYFGGEGTLELCKSGELYWTLYTKEGDTFKDDGGDWFYGYPIINQNETKTVHLYFSMSTPHNATKISYQNGIYQQESSVI